MGIQWSVQAAPPPLHPATTATSYERVDHGVLQASQGLSKALAGASSSEEALAQEASHELQLASGTLSTLHQLKSMQATVDNRLAALKAQAAAPPVHAVTGASGGGDDGGGGDGSGGDN